MPRVHNIDGVRVPFSPGEEVEAEARQAEHEARNLPLEEWLGQMAESDMVLPRYVEDLFDAMLPAQQANVSKKTRDSISEKKAKRLARP